MVWTRISADLASHVPTAPSAGPTGLVTIALVVRSSLCARSEQTKHCQRSHENTHHGSTYLKGRSRLAIRKTATEGHGKCHAAWFEEADDIWLFPRLISPKWPKSGICGGGTRVNRRDVLLGYCEIWTAQPQWLRGQSRGPKSLHAACRHVLVKPALSV
jgi:hypothetical protein